MMKNIHKNYKWRICLYENDKLKITQSIEQFISLESDF